MKDEDRDYRLLPFTCTECNNDIFVPPAYGRICPTCAAALKMLEISETGIL